MYSWRCSKLVLIFKNECMMLASRNFKPVSRRISWVCLPNLNHPSFTQSDWRLGWCIPCNVTENRTQICKRRSLNPLYLADSRANLQIPCTLHSQAISLYNQDRHKSSVVNHSKATPDLVFICFWWNKMQQNVTEKNTALRDKSAQNCAKTSPQTFQK